MAADMKSDRDIRRDHGHPYKWCEDGPVWDPADQESDFRVMMILQSVDTYQVNMVNAIETIECQADGCGDDQLVANGENWLKLLGPRYAEDGREEDLAFEVIGENDHRSSRVFLEPTDDNVEKFFKRVEDAHEDTRAWMEDWKPILEDMLSDEMEDRVPSYQKGWADGWLDAFARIHLRAVEEAQALMEALTGDCDDGFWEALGL